MLRGRRIFTTALLSSLAVHLLVVGNAPRWWNAPAREIPFPIEAHLAPLKTVDRAEPHPAPLPVPAEPRSTIPAPAPMVEASPEPPPQLDPVPTVQTPAAAPAPVPAPQVEPPTRAAEAPAAPPVTPSESKPRGEARPLPERLALVYHVRSGGESGFNLGQATYAWQVSGERYSLTSVAEATGLASLFMNGRIEQKSEGRIGPAGLMPEQFSMARGQKRLDVARFDWSGKRLILAKGEELLRDNAQDLLSFPFHLAMTVAEGAEGWILPVTNGRKLKGYRFAIAGRESVEVGRERLDAVHVQGTRAFEGTLDVWLAPGRHWLPVRIRTEDPQGKVMELTLARLEG